MIMSFELKLSLSLSSEPKLEYAIPTKEQTFMSDSWGAQKAASPKAKAEQERIKQETELRAQNFINARALPLWQELTSTLQKMATDFNRHYGEDYLMVLPGETSNTLFIQSPKGKAELQFNQAIPEITISPGLDAGRANRMKFYVESREVLFLLAGVTLTRGPNCGMVI